MLDRFEHYISLTIDGRRVGPTRVGGPHLDQVFAEYTRPGKVAALERAARITAGAVPRAELIATAAAPQDRVGRFLAQRAPAAAASEPTPFAAKATALHAFRSQSLTL